MPAVSRWSGSAWAFFRRGSGRQLAAGGGLLGGSQVGARLGYRVNDDPAHPLAISARFYAPVRRPRSSEAALGVEWKPIGGLPVTLLAERRQRIGRDGRSAFAALAYGGVSERRLVGPVELDAYVQAGIVGAKRRDAFVDGSAVLGLPLGESRSLKLGLGVWGAAQPGVSRVDAGPQVSYRLPLEGQAIRITAEWRMRIAGDAAPGSGPALTLSTAF